MCSIIGRYSSTNKIILSWYTPVKSTDKSHSSLTVYSEKSRMTTGSFGLYLLSF